MDIRIGKYTLETLTTGMYDSPKDLYREYIQNSTDAIDNALKNGILSEGKGCIDILINKNQKFISVVDNGEGISHNNAVNYLLDIGNSNKRLSNDRGFRGIGRLAGLAYCSELVFETSCYGEDMKTIVRYDANALKKELSNFCDTKSLDEIISNVVSIKTEKESKAKHYMRVSLSDVIDMDAILNFDSVKNYLSQVAPVPFSPDFEWGKMIDSKLRYYGYRTEYYQINISNGEIVEQIYKNYGDSFIADRVRKVTDRINDIEIREIKYNKEILGYLWYATTNYLGSIQDDKIKSIRLRKGNIQLGNKSALNRIFKDERFNGWCLGELHIVSSSLVPNARRDDLEKNDDYYNLINELKSWSDNISLVIKKISVDRNSDRKASGIINGTNAEIDIDNVQLISEYALEEKEDYDDVTHSELVNALDLLIHNKNAVTKYKALNISNRFSVEQKKMLEKVFDTISSQLTSGAENLINIIIESL